MKSSLGYSLVGLLVAVALGTVVCLGAAYVMTRSQYTATFASLQSELDRLHYLSLQKARNLAYIRQQLGLPDNASLQSCFAQQKSTTCNSFAGTKEIPKEATSKTGFDKNLDSEIAVTSECANDVCQQVKVTVNTTYDTPPTQTQQGGMTIVSYSPRHTVVYYPAFVIAPPTGIDYGCAFNQIMTGVNAGDLTAICTPVSGNLTGGNPLSNFGDSSPTPSTQAPGNTTCGPNQFVAQAGIFAGQTVCQTVTNISVPPPPPVVTLPPPTTTTTLNKDKCNPAKNPTCIETTVRECFLAGTPVLMADGSQKAIEKIAIGDVVAAYDEISGRRIDSPVTETLHHEAKLQQLFHFVMEDGSNFTSNDVHLIYVPSLHGYFSAAGIAELWNQSHDLALMGDDGATVMIAKINQYTDVVPMYNLHVQGISQASPNDLGRGHNYFVDGILVHNSKCIQTTDTGGCTAFAGALGSMHGAVTIWDAACYPSALTLISNFDIPYNGNMGRGIETPHKMDSAECKTTPPCNVSCGTPNGGGYCVYLKNKDKFSDRKPGDYCKITEAQCLCPDNTLGGFWKY